MRSCGVEPPYPEDEIYPVPREISPTGKKTARHGLVVRRSSQGNRPLEPVAMEWGFPTQVPSKRDPAMKLDKYVTNARNLASSMWKPLRPYLLGRPHCAPRHRFAQLIECGDGFSQRLQHHVNTPLVIHR